MVKIINIRRKIDEIQLIIYSFENENQFCNRIGEETLIAVFLQLVQRMDQQDSERKPNLIDFWYSVYSLSQLQFHELFSWHCISSLFSNPF